MRDDSAEIVFQSFLQEADVSSSSMGGAVHSLVLSIQQTTASPTLQRAPEDGFRQAVKACDIPEPCKVLCLDSRQERFPLAQEEVHLAPHPVVGLVLQVRDAEKFSQAHGFECFYLFFSVSKQGPCFTAIEEEGSDKGLAQLELAC